MSAKRKKYRQLVASVKQQCLLEVSSFDVVAQTVAFDITDENQCFDDSDEQSDVFAVVEPADLAVEESDVDIDPDDMPVVESDNESEIDEENQKFDFVQNLSMLLVKSHSTRSFSDELLGLLHKTGKLDEYELPKDSRTVLKTPKLVDIVEKCGGSFVYFGLAKSLSYALHNSSEMITDVAIDVNVDGLPISKSTPKEFWPILCSVVGKNLPPVVVAIFYGQHGKPYPAAEFLDDFVQEANHLISNGFFLHSRLVSLSIRSFICDAPARSFIKSVVGHTGKHACERCTVVGVYKDRRIVFLEDNVCPRSDANFRANLYEKHKTENSVLLQLQNLNMITDFVLDPMHLIYLGIVRRFLHYIKSHIGEQLWSVASERLVSYSVHTPSEFARKARSLSELDRWKATEFRQFVLYTGMAALRGIVSPDVYNLFLSLSVAITVLCNDNDTFRNSLLDYAANLLLAFVRNCRIIFGDCFLSYNVHSAIHIVDDVRHFGVSLNDLGGFSFENYLQVLKRSVRDCKRNPLVSASKRIIELQQRSLGIRKKISDPVRLSTNERDKYFVTPEGLICEVKEIDKKVGYVCEVFKSTSLKSFFEIPTESSNLGIYYCSNSRTLRTTRRTVTHLQGCRKLYVLPRKDAGLIFIPMVTKCESS
jgi:hypothetical protein